MFHPEGLRYVSTDTQLYTDIQNCMACCYYVEHTGRKDALCFIHYLEVSSVTRLEMHRQGLAPDMPLTVDGHKNSDKISSTGLVSLKPDERFHPTAESTVTATSP